MHFPKDLTVFCLVNAVENSNYFHWTLCLTVFAWFWGTLWKFPEFSHTREEIGSKTPANKGAQAKTQAISDLFNSRPKPVSQRQEQ